MNRILEQIFMFLYFGGAIPVIIVAIFFVVLLFKKLSKNSPVSNEKRVNYNRMAILVIISILISIVISGAMLIHFVSNPY